MTVVLPENVYRRIRAKYSDFTVKKVLRHGQYKKVPLVQVYLTKLNVKPGEYIVIAYEGDKIVIEPLRNFTGD